MQIKAKLNYIRFYEIRKPKKTIISDGDINQIIAYPGVLDDEDGNICDCITFFIKNQNSDELRELHIDMELKDAMFFAKSLISLIEALTK